MINLQDEQTRKAVEEASSFYGKQPNISNVPMQQGQPPMDGQQPMLSPQMPNQPPMLGEMLPQQQNNEVTSIYDLPEEIRPVKLSHDSKGRVKPDYNLNTRTGKAFYLRDQGVSEAEIAKRLGAKDPEDLKAIMRKELTQLRDNQMSLGALKPSERLNISKEYGLPYNFTEKDLMGAKPTAKKEETGKELPATTIEGMAGLVGAIEGVEKLVQEKSNVDTGLLSSSIQGVQDVFSAAPQGYTTMTQTKDKLLGDFQKAMSGLTVSDREAARIQKLMPSMYDNDEKFILKSKNFKEELDKLRRNQSALFKEGGYRVPESFIGKNNAEVPANNNADPLGLGI